MDAMRGDIDQLLREEDSRNLAVVGFGGLCGGLCHSWITPLFMIFEPTLLQFIDDTL